MAIGPARLCIGAIGLFMTPAGMQAAFAPRSFFDDFPIGRGWIAAEGGVDRVGLVGSLVMVPALAGAALATQPRVRSGSNP